MEIHFKDEGNKLKADAGRNLKAAEMNLIAFLDWAAFGILTGIVVGMVGAAFALILGKFTAYRMEHPQLVLGLPIAALTIVFMYRHLGEVGDKGTNLVINSVREGHEVPWFVAVRIFIATAITHLFGGSAGREGAALQLGSSISSTLSKILGRKKHDKTITVLCGMSAAFSALFGTPLASTIFAMEVVNVGEMYYAALVPCSFAALSACMAAKALGVQAESFHLLSAPELTFQTFFKVLILAIGCALISVIFCIILHMAHHFFRKAFKNQYVAGLAASIMIIALTAIVNSSDYMGTGMHVIERAVEGEAHPEAFVLKMIFTALALGSCYKGGEIVPSFFVGATFGCVAGQVLGLSPSLCAGIGMVAVFCGVTNCPVSSLLIAAELFGFHGMHYFLIGVTVSYMLSGYRSLYTSQKIIFGKLKTGFLGRNGE